MTQQNMKNIMVVLLTAFPCRTAIREMSLTHCDIPGFLQSVSQPLTLRSTKISKKKHKKLMTVQGKAQSWGQMSISSLNWAILKTLLSTDIPDEHKVDLIMVEFTGS